MKSIDARLSRFYVGDYRPRSSTRVTIPESRQDCPPLEQLYCTICDIQDKGWEEIETSPNDDTVARCHIKFQRADETLVLSWRNPHYSSVAAIIE